MPITDRGRNSLSSAFEEGAVGDALSRKHLDFGLLVIRHACSYRPFAQYVSAQPATVIVRSKSIRPVLTMLSILPWPRR